ncbi:hypothetical protein GJ496_008885 [Pomphorhynchus laevis]|nr:hypothetical protein GJ496_008885 [Pomphorhynchus laevis]
MNNCQNTRFTDSSNTVHKVADQYELYQTSTPYLKRNPSSEDNLVSFLSESSRLTASHSNDLSLTLVTPENSRILNCSSKNAAMLNNPYEEPCPNKIDIFSMRRASVATTYSSTSPAGSSKTWVLTSSDDESSHMYNDPCTRLAGLMLGIVRPVTISEEIAVAISNIMDSLLCTLGDIDDSTEINDSSTFVNTIARLSLSLRQICEDNNSISKTVPNRVNSILNVLNGSNLQNLSDYAPVCNKSVPTTVPDLAETLKSVIESVQNTNILLDSNSNLLKKSLNEIMESVKLICENNTRQDENLNNLATRLSALSENHSQIIDFHKSKFNEISEIIDKHLIQRVESPISDVQLKQITHAIRSQMDDISNKNTNLISGLNEKLLTRVEARIEQARKDILRRMTFQQKEDTLRVTGTSKLSQVNKPTCSTVSTQTNVNSKDFKSQLAKGSSFSQKIEITKQEYDIMQNTIKRLYAENEKLNVRLKKSSN